MSDKKTDGKVRDNRSPELTVQTFTALLDELWASTRIRLPVSVLNALTAAFLAAPAPTALVRMLPIRTGAHSVSPQSAGQQLWWIDQQDLCSTALPVPESNPAIVRRKLPGRKAHQPIDCLVDPSLADRVLALSFGFGLAEFDAMTGQWTDLWADLQRRSACGRLSACSQVAAVDRAGGAYVVMENVIHRLNCRTGALTAVAGTPAGSRDGRQRSACDPLTFSFDRVAAIGPVWDGSRLFVIDGDGIARIDFRQRPIGPDDDEHGYGYLCGVSPGVSTLPARREVAFMYRSICWLSSERLLIGDSEGRVHCWDLISGQWYVAADLMRAYPGRERGFFETLDVSLAIDEAGRRAYAGMLDSLFELDISPLLPPL